VVVREELRRPRVRFCERSGPAGERARLHHLASQVHAARLDRQVILRHVLVGTDQPPPRYPRGGSEHQEDDPQPPAGDDHEHVEIRVGGGVVGGERPGEHQPADERQVAQAARHPPGAALQPRGPPGSLGPERREARPIVQAPEPVVLAHDRAQGRIIQQPPAQLVLPHRHARPAANLAEGERAVEQVRVDEAVEQVEPAVPVHARHRGTSRTVSGGAAGAGATASAATSIRPRRTTDASVADMIRRARGSPMQACTPAPNGR
jgi:hypothetical protein